MLTVEGLEGRIVPAVVGNLSIVGSTLVYSGNDADNAISITGDDATLTITDAAGAIASTVPGFVIGGGTATGAVPSYVRAIAINGGNGTDTITIGSALSTSRGLLLTAETVSNTAAIQAAAVTETGTVLNLGAEVATNQGGPLAGPATFDGTVVLGSAPVLIDTTGVVDGDVTFLGAIAGAQDLQVNAGTGGNINAAGPVNLGGGLSGLGLTGNTVALHQVVDTTGVSILAQNAVTLNGSLVSGGPVSILANQDGAGGEGFTQVAGDIITTSSAPNAVVLQINQTFGGGTGSATVRGITVGTGAIVLITTASTATTGGAVVDGNGAGGLNVDIPAGGGGALTLDAGPGGVNLDTSVPALSAFETASPFDQPVTLRNSGTPLEVTALTTQGDVNITNNSNIQVDFIGPIDPTYGGNVSLATASGGNVALGFVALGGPSSALAIRSTGNIEAIGGGSAFLVAPVLNFSAATGIGAASDLEIDPSAPAVSVNATTDSGGITLTSIVSMTVNQATAGAGPIVLNSFEDLTAKGNITTANGGAVTLSAFGNLVLEGSVVSSDTGLITLEPTAALTVAAGTTVATGGDLVVAPEPFASDIVESFDGTLAASGDVVIAGALNTTLLNLVGTVAAGGTLTIDTTQTAGSSTLLLAGALDSTGDLSVLTGGATLLTASAGSSMNSGGATTLSNSSALSATNLGSVTMLLGGTIESTGDVQIDGATGGAPTAITLSGTTSSATGIVSVVSNGAALGDTFLLNTTGTIGAGGGIAIHGSTGDTNTFNVGGTLGAPTIDVSAAGDAATSLFDVSGVLLAPGGATFESGTGADSFVIAPSPQTQFRFTFGAGASTLQIVTALANILQADVVFAAPILFAPTSGFGSWFSLGGVVLVTPTVP